MPDPLHIESTFNASPERVFKALLSPEDLNVWAWAGLGSDPQATVDPTPGGRYDISIAAPDAMPWTRPRLAMRGYFIDIDPPRRLAYTLHWDAPVVYNQTDEACPDEFVVIELSEPEAGTCTMNYRHFGIPSPEAEAMHREGIVATHQRLATLLEK